MSSVWFNPNDKTVYGSHEADQVVGTYMGKIAVKDENDQVVQVNADDIGKSVQAIGNGIAKIGESISRINYVWNNTADTATTPIWINGSNKPFAYISETSSGTTASAEPLWKPITASGPMRTTTYTTTTDTDRVAHLAWSDEFIMSPHNHAADTMGAVWHHNDTLGDTIYAYDPQMMGGKPLSQKVIDRANKKSMKLLKEWLSDAEYKYLMEEGNLELPSQHEKDTIYIVNKDPMKRIGIKKKGKVVEKSLCIHASHSYPTGDVLLANIMLLKTDEKKFLEIANVHNFYV